MLLRFEVRETRVGRARARASGAFSALLIGAFGATALCVLPREGQASEVVGTSVASGKASVPKQLSLSECLELARANFPKVHGARARLKRAESEKREARLMPFGEVHATAGAGILPSWRGTSLYSPNSDAGLTGNMALAYQIGVEGVIPLWTFGKFTSLWAAADAAVDASQSDVQKAKNEVELEVHRAYYGVLFARDARLLIAEVRGELNQGIERLEEKLSSGEGDDLDLLKLKMVQAELEARGSEAGKQEQIALAGLRFFTGVERPLDLPDVPLVRSTHELGPLPVYLEAARLHRPELNMVRAGLRARRALVELERAKYLPDLGIAFAAKMTRAPEVTDQRNPFANDPLNAPFVGFGLAMRWKLDFLPQTARVAKAQADLEEMRATERFAIGGIAVEVEEAYRGAADAKERADAWHRSAHFAKQWLIRVQQGAELGLIEEDEFVEPAKEYALKRFSEMQAIFEYNVAVAKLGQTTGWPALLGESA